MGTVIITLSEAKSNGQSIHVKNNSDSKVIIQLSGEEHWMTQDDVANLKAEQIASGNIVWEFE